MGTSRENRLSEREAEKRKKREADRYYLLPGQGRGAKKWRRNTQLIAFLTGILLASLLGLCLWLYHNREWM